MALLLVTGRNVALEGFSEKQRLQEVVLGKALVDNTYKEWG